MSKRKSPAESQVTLSSSILLKSAYELAREANIRENDAILASLGLAPTAAEASADRKQKD
jgi:hypothetical protein